MRRWRVFFSRRRRHTRCSRDWSSDVCSSDLKREAEGVFVVANGVAAFRPVKVGIAGDEYFEVADGLKEGETIVAGPYQSIRDLKDSARVRPMKQAADTTKKKK